MTVMRQFTFREKLSTNARAASGALRGVLQESEDEEEKDKALALTTAVHRQGAATSSQSLAVRGHSWVETLVREAGQAGDTAPLGDDTAKTDRRRNEE